MPQRHFFTVGWCKCAVIRDAGDGSMASAPRRDATLIADGRCVALVARSKGCPGLRWVTSRPGRELIPDPDLKGCAAVAVAPIRYVQRVPDCVRHCCSANRRWGVAGPGAGRVSPPWTASAAGYWSDAPDSLAHDSSAAHVGRDPNSLRMDLHGCRRVRHVCPGTRARRFFLAPHGPLRCEKIGSARIGKAQDDSSVCVGEVVI